MMQFVVPKLLKKDVFKSLSVSPFSPLLLSDTWGSQLGDHSAQFLDDGNSCMLGDSEVEPVKHWLVA
jgi:hypothetical protein